MASRFLNESGLLSKWMKCVMTEMKYKVVWVLCWVEYLRGGERGNFLEQPNRNNNNWETNKYRDPSIQYLQVSQ